MGRGRAPCCDKNQVKRGPWSPSEDLRLINFIQNHGHDNWRALPKQAGLLRCGKSCRLRWINYLRPDVKRGNFTIEEEETIIKLHQSFGNKWSKIASHLPGRTDNEIKNFWNTHLKKKLLLSDPHGGGTENKPTPHKVESNQESCTTSLSSSPSSSSSSSISGEKGIGKQLDIEQKTAEKELIWDHELSVSTSHELKGVDSNQFGCGKLRDCEDQSQSLFDFRDLCDVRDDNTFEEVNKPNTIEVSDDVLGTISFEADNDFWNMLDNLGSSFQSNGSINEINQLLELDQEVDPYPAGQLDTGYQQVVTSEDTEKSKWFRYLESELGLEETIDNGCNSSAST